MNGIQEVRGSIPLISTKKSEPCQTVGSDFFFVQTIAKPWHRQNFVSQNIRGSPYRMYGLPLIVSSDMIYSASSQKALKVRYAMYTSALDTTSKGECMESTGTPMSMVSIS